MPSGGHNCKSVEEHKANGTYRPSRHDRTKVDLAIREIESSDKPKNLDDVAEKLYDKIVACFAGTNWLTPLDVEHLTAACHTWSLAERCRELVETDPTDRDARQGHLQYVKLFESFAASLGLRPSDRKRLGIESGEKETPSLADFTRKR